jgi:hypothetical protein
VRSPILFALPPLLTALGCSPEPSCPDRDGDGYCAMADGGTDCDDGDPSVHPGAQERCGDALDQDCSGDPDDADLDGDGAVDAACGGADCDDLDPSIHPSADELCGDTVDQDCSGDPDDADFDSDGWVDAACGGEDCDDREQYVNPDRLERCDGLDNDCDGHVPEDEQDLDGDGYLACADDCNDDDPSVHPGAAETLDGADSDCDDVVCAGATGGDLATCLLAWLSRYDEPTGCTVDLRAMDEGQPAVALAVETALGLEAGGRADREDCLDAVASVEAALSSGGQLALIEPVCVEGIEGEHLLMLRERDTGQRGGLALIRLAGWRPRVLDDGTEQAVVLGAPQRDHATPPACGDADLHTFHIALGLMLESDVPRAMLTNGFPRGAINPTGTGTESDLADALPGLLEARGVPAEERPNRGALAARGETLYYALANPMQGSSVRDAILAVEPEGSALPHCVFGHPDWIGPDGSACDVADDTSPYLDDIRSLHAAGDWLLVVDGGSQPTLFALSLLDSGAADGLALEVNLATSPGEHPFCSPGPTALHMEGESGHLLLVDEGGGAGCGDGGAKLVRLPVHPAEGGVGAMETVSTGLTGAAALAVDAEGNAVVALAQSASASQDLLAFPLALSSEPDPALLLSGDDCRLVDSRYGVDHSLEDLASLAFSPGGLLLLADRDGNELFGAVLGRDPDGALRSIERLTETDLADVDGLPVLQGLIAQDDWTAWLLVDEDGGGQWDLVSLELFSRGDLIQAGNEEEKGRLSPFHHYLEATARHEAVLHLQLHGYDEHAPEHADLVVPGSAPAPFDCAALLSPGLPWGSQTSSVARAVVSFQRAFEPSGSEVVFPHPVCITHHALGARTNRQGQLLNYGELQEGLDGLARHYDDPSGDPPSDELIHIEWPLGLREALADGDSEAAAYLRDAIEALVTERDEAWACPFEPDDDLPALPQECSQGW